MLRHIAIFAFTTLTLLTSIVSMSSQGYADDEEEYQTCTFILPDSELFAGQVFETDEGLTRWDCKEKCFDTYNEIQQQLEQIGQAGIEITDTIGDISVWDQCYWGSKSLRGYLDNSSVASGDCDQGAVSDDCYHI